MKSIILLIGITVISHAYAVEVVEGQCDVYRLGHQVESKRIRLERSHQIAFRVPTVDQRENVFSLTFDYDGGINYRLGFEQIANPTAWADMGQQSGVSSLPIGGTFSFSYHLSSWNDMYCSIAKKQN